MMEMLNSLFDPYDRKARLAPALLCALPLFVSLLLLVPEVGAVWAVVGGLVLYCGGAKFLTQVGRDRGKVLEPKLYASWGGKPSVAMLRHSDMRLNAPTKSRYRAFLQRAVPGLRLASPDEERISPEAAEDGYESANSWLLAQTRDRERFRLLFAENINYGFRRNVWALRPWAFCLAAIAIIVVALVGFQSWTGELSTTFDAVGVELWASLVFILVHAFFFRTQGTLCLGPARSRRLRAAASGSVRCSRGGTWGLSGAEWTGFVVSHLAPEFRRNDEGRHKADNSVAFDLAMGAGPPGTCQASVSAAYVADRYLCSLFKTRQQE